MAGSERRGNPTGYKEEAAEGSISHGVRLDRRVLEVSPASSCDSRRFPGCGGLRSAGAGNHSAVRNRRLALCPPKARLLEIAAETEAWTAWLGT